MLFVSGMMELKTNFILLSAQNGEAANLS